MKACIHFQWPVLTGAWSRELLEDLLVRVYEAGVDPGDWSAVRPIWDRLRAQYQDAEVDELVKENALI
jgi:hypothetical protein